MSLTEKDVENRLDALGKNHPRLDGDIIDNKITGEDYHLFLGSTVTVCKLTLENGFSVIGQSACASPENFDAQLGRELARKDARQQIWQLEGYLLRQRLYNEATGRDQI